MRRNVTEKNVRHRALEDCKKAGVGPLAAMYVRSGYFIQRASCKPSRERMCLGAMSEGVCCARWTQIDAIARANVPCRPLEWRLPCQMNCRNRGQRAITICGNGEHRCTGGLAPIIKVRFSGPPWSGTLRGVDTVIWRKDVRTVTSPM